MLEVLDDSDSSIRELALSLIVEMLKNQVRTPFCAIFCWIMPLFISVLATAHMPPHISFLRHNKRPFNCCVYCFQKDAMENSVEIVVEKLLNVTKDIVPKVSSFIMFLIFFYVVAFFSQVLQFSPLLQVSNEAEHCLTIVLSQNDPFRCLSVCISWFFYLLVILLRCLVGEGSKDLF